jgi:hypothetical protein
MSKTENYLEQAVRCVKRARKATEPREESLYLLIAEAWLDKAHATRTGDDPSEMDKPENVPRRNLQ